MIETISFIVAVVTIIWAYVIISRLNEIADNTRQSAKRLARLGEHLFALRYPEIPWPPPEPDSIVLEETRSDGRDYRMRADGQWQVYHRRRWIFLSDDFR